MEKEKVFEIEFKEVWEDKWAWRVIKNDIPYSKELKKIEFKRIKTINTHKNSLFFLDSFEDGYKQLDDFELILTNEKLEVEDFIKYVNQKYGIPKRWRAKSHEIYYIINDIGYIISCTEEFTQTDSTYYNLGNYFKSTEEAIKFRDTVWKDLWIQRK